MNNCKYRLRKLSVGLVSVGTMFMATTVSGEEVAQPQSPVAASPNQNEAQPATKEEEVPLAKTVEVAAPTPAPQATSPSAVTAESTSTPQKKEEKVVEAPAQESAPKTPVEAEATSTTGQESQAPARSRNKRSAETPQTVEAETTEVDKISVDNAKTEVTVSDEKKLVKNRDDEQRKLFDVSREVVADADGKTLNVTLTVKPKQIDKGAEVIVLLDVSKKMSKENIDTAKENIKKLV